MKRSIVVAVVAVASGLVIDGRAGVRMVPVPLPVPIMRPVVPMARRVKKSPPSDLRPRLEERIRVERKIRTQA